ncbi:tRNA (uracil-5-)-methyltransferase [Arcobacter nitrofigilis DSM 7299]|uniref:tRNA (Uracil-5-)-methyltransferase n=2 Tax=Arcobacter nitrofigilis TaxID=28199 RepID=D5V7E7_ARCNC|nr:tRNA (uridine(54)-C5)-methyltransferase TrmA [Arcobacter nitrofigilis]ADG94567.1 tRNA (uracil-5-)-methyltransferase [Arcobacter nitrofigilis DSM 7299]
MTCDYFGKCGSCTLYHMNYEEQLAYKLSREKQRFQDITTMDFEIIRSEEEHFRNRAEFRFWKNYDDEKNPTLSYGMTSFDKNILEVDKCSIVSKQIDELMPKLLDEISQSEILNYKIYSVEFLGSTTNDMLVTLIYHKKLDTTWEKVAKEVQERLNIKIIGRSRKQKIVLKEDFIKEELNINDNVFKFHYKEGGFTQPNTKVNIKMIEWVLNNIETKDDLCELYCGGGNFTIPLSTKFNKVLATEISKTSINSALLNCELNNITNIDFIRMSAEEFVEALNSVREFRRLKDINLSDYNFSTIFVDPPRSGLDDTTRELVKNYEQIIYISCNPETLHRDLKELIKSHQILNFSLFDQFSYSGHIETGVILKKSC